MDDQNPTPANDDQAVPGATPPVDGGDAPAAEPTAPADDSAAPAPAPEGEGEGDGNGDAAAPTV